MYKIFGIDPGLADTGIGIVSGRDFEIENYSFGCISTNKDTPLAQRLGKIYDNILKLLEEHKPDRVIVEDIFSLERYPKSGILLGKVTGAILLASYHTKIPVFEVPVREAKKILSGNGNASKAQLEQSVRHVLEHDSQIKPYHASDALALALIGLFRYNTEFYQKEDK